MVKFKYLTDYFFFFIAPTLAVKPVLIEVTDLVEPHALQTMKCNLLAASLFNSVFIDLQVLQMTYSWIYLLKTPSIFLAWNLPLIINLCSPSMEPEVPNSAKRYWIKWDGFLCKTWAICWTLAKTVFLLPSLKTSGGGIFSLCCWPPASSGFFSFKMP